MDGWNTTVVSFWGPAYFQGLLLLVSGSVLFNSQTKPNITRAALARANAIKTLHASRDRACVPWCNLQVTFPTMLWGWNGVGEIDSTQLFCGVHEHVG